MQEGTPRPSTVERSVCTASQPQEGPRGRQENRFGPYLGNAGLAAVVRIDEPSVIAAIL